MGSSLVPGDSKAEKQRPQYPNLPEQRTRWLLFILLTLVVLMCLIGNVVMPRIYESERIPPPAPGRTSYPPANWAYVESFCDRLNNIDDVLFDLGERGLTRSKDWKSTGHVQCLLVNDPATSLEKITYLEVTISEVKIHGSPLKALQDASKRYQANGFEEWPCLDGAQCWRKSGDADTPALAVAQLLPYEVRVALTEQPNPPGQSQQKLSEDMNMTTMTVLDHALEMLAQDGPTR